MATSPINTPRLSTSQSSDRPDSASQAASRNGSVSDTTASSAPNSLGLPTALKPIGIINEQNTCFLNSTFQALSATAPLISLLNSSRDGPIIPAPLSLLPPPIISGSRIPALIPEANEPPLYPLLPVTKTFLASLQKSWKMKDAGGGMSGSGETSSSRSMRLHHLLREMARKYDQYDDYMQQDAHELLRHLLDSMEMEEKDVIKRVQPAPTPAKKKKHKDGISPLPSAAPSPAPSAPASPTRSTSIHGHLSAQNSAEPSRSAPADAVSVEVSPQPREIPEEERLVPFVDILFGGLLASVVVCENCKSVSHTYEGFLDISLSLKGDAPKTRKRDKLKAAFGLRTRGSLSKGGANETSTGSVMSESEMSDNDEKNRYDSDRSRRQSMDQDDRLHTPDDANGIRRNSSISSKFGLKGKPSFSFGKKKPKSSSSSSSLPSVVDLDKTPPATSIPGSPNASQRYHGPGPTPAQNAYIQRILSGEHVSHHDDPLAKLKAANAGEGLTVNAHKSSSLTGLEESLKAFTSVEVLEGENAFACRKCWRIKTGKYKNTQATLPEEDEGTESLHSTHRFGPAISVVGSDSGSEVLTTDSEQRLGRASSAASRSSAASQPPRAPSPLRNLRQIDTQQSARDISYATSAISVDTSSIQPEPDNADSDGLSDSSSSEDEPIPADLPLGVRPKMPTRKQSSHFTMRRAFKRYLIAQAPEVLVFHFKRFRQTQKSGLTFTSFYDLKKMDDFVSFPEVFDLSPYLAPNRNDYKVVPTASGPHAPYMDWPSPEHGPETQEPVMYRLYALVVHLGSMIGGHYIAYVLVDPEVMFKTNAEPTQADHAGMTEGVDAMSLHNAVENEIAKNGDDKSSTARPQGLPKKDRRVWCYCSDTSIRLASVEEVLAAKAYICFYEKVPIGRS